ncbi:hypothetical protein ACTMSW_02085 [Micromonospora sp. BQ11]|uniref:hypothetical protein n=1 Tax=Micromonospora sp. BQ11 TaxID=3452212 RepID=UPI003F8B3410
MTEIHHVWLRRDESQQQPVGAVRADTITSFSAGPALGGEELRAIRVTAGAENAVVGTCLTAYVDRAITGLLAILEATKDFDSRFVVIEAIPVNEQDGPDQNFWSVYDNEWPPAEKVVPAARPGA